jgi:predicted nucleic acid-binding protein
MKNLLAPLCAHTPTIDFYDRAFKIHASNSISFYDALIVQAALDLKCKKLYSEDLQAGQKFDSLVITNPFV